MQVCNVKNTNTETSEKIVLNIPELKDLILEQIATTPHGKAVLMRLCKTYYKQFKEELYKKPLIPFVQSAIISYYDKLLTINPRLSYANYQQLSKLNKNIDLKCLDYYKIKVYTHFPFKQTLSVILSTNIINSFFAKNHKISPIYPSLIIILYFGTLYAITLFLFFKFNYCLNPNNLFTFLTIASIMLNIISNILPYL